MIWSNYSSGKSKDKPSTDKDKAVTNMCKVGGPQSFCEGKNKEEREGCTYYAEGRRQDCMHFHKNMHGACDCVWAQRGIAKPK